MNPGEGFDWGQFDEFRGEWNYRLNELLEGLASPDPAKRENARGVVTQWPFELLEDIGRLGAVPHVISAILGLTADPNTPERAELLEVATWLATTVSQYKNFRLWFRGEPEDLERAVEARFREGSVTFVKALESLDPRLRAAAADAIRVAKDKSAVPPLRTALARDADSRAIESMLEALGELGAIEALPEIHHHFDSQTVKVRAAAAVALVRVTRPWSDLSLRRLAELVIIGTNIDEPRTPEIEFEERDASIAAMQQLQRMGEKCLQEAVEHWTVLSKEIRANNLLEFFWTVLRTVFPQQQGTGQSSDPRYLPHQILLLATIAACDAFWSISVFEDKRTYIGLPLRDANGFRRDLLSSRKLPESRTDLRELVEREWNELIRKRLL